MRLVILSFAFLALLASPAIAQPGMSPPGQSSPFDAPPSPTVDQYPTQTTTTTSYGWQVFAADATSWVLLGASDDSEGVASVAALSVFFGGPIVHLANGNSKGAGYSLLARTALPLGGVLLGIAACDDDGYDDYDCLAKPLIGGMLGYGSALVIDWFMLAKKTEVKPATGWASVRPSLQLAPGGAKASVAFNF